MDHAPTDTARPRRPGGSPLVPALAALSVTVLAGLFWPDAATWAIKDGLYMAAVGAGAWFLFQCSALAFTRMRDLGWALLSLWSSYMFGAVGLLGAGIAGAALIARTAH